MENSTLWELVLVTPENVGEIGLFCIKNKKTAGYRAKLEWFKQQYELGLRMTIALGADGKQAGFVECIPAEFSWRPLHAPGYLFIHCLYVYSKKDRKLGLGRTLLAVCDRMAREQEMQGVCTMTSDGPWLSGSSLFEKYGYTVTENKDRYGLAVKRITENGSIPRLANWTAQQKQYEGWHLVYANQCPWHEKAVLELGKVATEVGIELNITQLITPKEAREAPSGFGTFSLLHNGRLLADHYISATRFKNILKKEL